MATQPKKAASAAAKKPLTDSTVRSAKLGTHPDGTVRGLSLIVTETGTRSWRLRYWVDGKEFVHTLGRFYILKEGVPLPSDHMGLQDARSAAVGVKAGARDGIHPKAEKQAKVAVRRAEQAQTFRAVAVEFVEHNLTANEWSPSTEKGHRYALAAIYGITVNGVPVGDTPIKQINPEHIRQALLPYQKSDPKRPTAERYAFSVIKRVLDYAKVARYVESNVADGCEGLISKRKKGEPRAKSHHAAILDPADLGHFLCKLEAHPLRSPSWYGMRLLTMLPVRPSELATMRWADLDLDTGWWDYTMPKVDRLHRVPLPRQAVEILRELRERRMGQAEYVLPSRLAPDRAMHPESIRLLLTKQMEYSVGTVTPHGFRATWRTLGKRHLKLDPDVLELAMGHETKDPLGGAYDRDDLMPERIEAMQIYADWLDQLREEAKLTSGNSTTVQEPLHNQ
ncbi:integrase [Pseudomonas sp. PAGU 2196]|uniref:tyrosine-type recombinase/integrase n=1 Tax=Pseudomonas sp. PAGU 2196 TaxID=2793997 RepID=UPI001EE0CCDB|nr:site-specific integrase [Pseudomonas sp. PAGU 2196]GHS82652.1 integrase [Pseudomonas sp. PAGU 2196]